jgi:RNA polymerase sigma-70 factor (ECF subfamily)
VMGPEDIELIELVYFGPEFTAWAAVEVLERRWRRPLRIYVHRMIRDREKARDIVQTIFLNLWRARRGERARFDPNHVSENGHPTTFRAWVYRVARNAARDATRQADRDRLVFVSGGDEDEASPPLTAVSREPTPEQLRMAREFGPEINDCINNLPDQLRELVHLRFEEGLTLQEIASILDRSVGTVHRWLARMEKLLAQCLKTKGIRP